MTYVDDVHISARLVRLVVFRVLQEDFVDVRGCVLEETVVTIEDHQGDFAATEHREFVGFFH